MDYDDLKKIAKEIYLEANNQNILSRLYWYSPESRKLKPASKIGYYDREPQRIRFKYGCKLIMVFPRLAFDDLASIINRHIPQNKQIAYREDFKCKADIGFDVYQKVEELKLFIEPDSLSSKEFTVKGMKRNGKKWAEYQEQALSDMDPPLSVQQQLEKLAEVKVQFKKALAYLEAKNDPKAKLRVRRLSGVRHRMIRADLAGDQSAKSGFSDLVLVFGTSAKLPQVVLPKEPNPNRKPNSNSIAAQYKANPASFKYYDKFGIFDVYDK
jgi:hypothetical protein